MLDHTALPYSAAPAPRKAHHLSVAVPGSDARVPAADINGTEARDAALLAAVAQRRDDAAFEALYASHRAGVVRTARRICCDEAIAEDIAQRSFMTLWERAERLAAKGVRVRPWLNTVARNAAIDYVRAQAPLVALDDAAHANAAHRSDAVCEPQDVAIANASADELRRALATLPAQQRSVVDALYFRGCTFAAIADETGEPLGTIKSRAYLALERLRRSLAHGTVR